LFTGAPLERFPGELSEQLGDFGLGRRLQTNIENVLPPFRTFGTRIIKAAQREQLPEMLISDATGLKVRSVDVRRVTRGNLFQRKKLLRQFLRRVKAEEARERGQDG
jgi:hypothetical protein